MSIFSSWFKVIPGLFYLEIRLGSHLVILQLGHSSVRVKLEVRLVNLGNIFLSDDMCIRNVQKSQWIYMYQLCPSLLSY